MAPHQELDVPVPTYQFAVGHPGTFHVGWPFNVTYDTFATKFSVNQAGDVYVAGDLMVSGNMRVNGEKEGYVVDTFINGAGDTLEQGDVLVIGSTDISHYSGMDNNIPLIEADLSNTAYDFRVCGIVASVVTKNDLPFNEIQAPDAKALARDANATEAALHRAVELGVNPFEIEGTGSGGRVLIDDVETAEKAGETSSTKWLEAYLNPLARFAGEITPESDATKIEDQQMGRMVTLGAFAHCKVDADIASISAGDLLTTSPTRGHAQKVMEPEKAAGAIVGKALASLSQGKGKIPVLVMLQ
jgi:pyruvate/2-oxoglutarate dehydrogenase complex dihydrolipoamide acyltransferase (E2) component